MYNKFICYSTRFGKLIHHKSDTCIGRSLKKFGEWAPGEIALLKQLVKPNDTVLDIGANIGFHSLLFSKLIGKNGTIIAFEPDKENHHLLQVNKAINAIDTLDIYNSLVGEKSTIHWSWTSEKNHTNLGATSFKIDVETTENTIPITQLAIDDLKLKSCDLIKIDVEGFELNVFKGMVDTLANLRPIVFFEQRNDLNFIAIFNIFKEVSYSFFWYVSYAYPKQNIYNNTDDFFKGATEVNILAIPKEKLNKIPFLSELQEIKTSDYVPPEICQLNDTYFQIDEMITSQQKEEVASLNKILEYGIV